ncbi:LPS-assembly lipoprotein [Angulomicrobium tetraedrale]|uniref:LPS-assembly lipoprotein n=1 Tax=Ancylobacter tetraedralis TaxID=217068 RepID=A0A839Z6F0_9HYPH|nr:hypothetical protein [Ancylobacter tetraedralis]MBB3770561.1 LPS-assembly lipoprotein [Ancylobacter tetraedralis]
MSSLDQMKRTPSRRLFGLAAAGLLAFAVAGCFKPMYAQDTADGGNLTERLGDIQVVFASGRIGNEVRNDLIFALTGGAGNPANAPYRLELAVTDSSTSTAVDSLSGLPEVEMVSVDVKWLLFDTTRTPGPDGKPVPPVAHGNAFGKASLYSGYQRFARARAIRDAQNRAAGVASETIKGQLAAYFIAPPPAAPATTASTPKS